MKRQARRISEAWGAHVADGSDAGGEQLPITIRIAPNGRIYFHDIPEALLPVALAMNPDDHAMQQRVKMAAIASERKLS